MNVTILGDSYSLYTHVHHTYGLNDAFDRSVAYLLTAQESQLDSRTESALQDSVQQKPLDQASTAVVTAATADDDAAAEEVTAETAEGRQLDQDASERSEEGLQNQVIQEDELSLAAVQTAESVNSSRSGQNNTAPAAVRRTQHHRLSAASKARGAAANERTRHLLQHDDPSLQEAAQLIQSSVKRDTDSSKFASSAAGISAGARRRSMLQEGVKGVEHPCLHEGYFKNYDWVAHGAHVADLPRVHLVGK